MPGGGIEDLGTTADLFSLSVGLVGAGVVRTKLAIWDVGSNVHLVAAYARLAGAGSRAVANIKPVNILAQQPTVVNGGNSSSRTGVGALQAIATPSPGSGTRGSRGTAALNQSAPAISGTNVAPPAPGDNWIPRSTGPGVVWAHNFDSANEVSAFRTASGYGNDPTGTNGSKVRHVANDGFAGGGCVEVYIDAVSSNGGWQRPLAAVDNNGKGTPDLAANGTVKIRSYNPNNPQTDYQFRTGYYGHPSVQAAIPSWKGDSTVWDGTEFYLQFRAKIQATRWSDINNPSGKLVFIANTGVSANQEIILQSSQREVYWNSTYPFRMYTNFGRGGLAGLSGPQGNGGNASIQPGGPYENTCRIGVDTSQLNDCWEWPADEWVTVLMHVIPGRDNRPFGDDYMTLAAAPYKDTVIEAWVARANETAYTKVFENTSLALIYDTPQTDASTGNQWHPPAFNAFIPSCYMNAGQTGVGASTPFYHRFTQCIMSKEYIQVPGLTAGSWWTA
jgi:hypothetical protein